MDEVGRLGLLQPAAVGASRAPDVPAQVELEDCPCPLGCAQDDEPVLERVHDLLHKLPGSYTLVRCKHCGLMRTNPRPSPASIGFYYPSDYGPYKVNTEPVAKGAIRRIFKEIVRRIFDERHTVVPDVPVGLALEVGCASGQFLEEMRRRGWKAEGIEYNPEAAQRARDAGFQVHVGQLEQAPTPAKPYDLVLAWMVLEHLHEPVRALAKLRDWSRPGAHLALSVPDCGAWEMRAFGKYWYALQIPTHLYHFDKRTLAKVLQAGGWRVVSMMNQRELWPFRQSINYLIDAPSLSTTARRALELLSNLLVRGWISRPLASVLAPLGQTGCMTVVAKRIDD